MSKLVACIFFVILLASCDSQTSNEKKVDQTSAKSSVLDVSNQLDGLWIGDNYLKSIESSKSIYKNRQYTTKMLGFYLSKANLVTDTAYLDGFSDHERGYSSPLTFDSSGTFVNDLTRLPEMPAFPEPFELNQKADHRIEMYFPKTKLTDTYRKVDLDLQTELRKTLIVGDYTDSSTKQQIQFSADGKVQNFRNFKYYDMIYDFDENIEYDAIVFFESLKGGSWADGKIYKFDIQSNTLKLQYVKTNWETMDHKMTDEIYTLVKK